MKIRWTRRALKRLDEIGSYLFQENPEAAGRMVGLIVANVQALGDHPAIGRIGRIAGTRELVVSGTKFVVAYRVVETEIEILSILHGAQRWPDGL